MEFRAVLHNTDNGCETIESVWLPTKEEAEKAGEKGLLMYGGTHYTIEEQ
jgi:hypothetical protein